jgi:hypothetical protein
MNDQPRPITCNGYLIVWLDSLFCWCILDEHGDKVREPFWSTAYEAEAAINSGEAL